MHRFCRPRCASPDRGGGKCHHARSCVRTMNARVATSKGEPHTRQPPTPTTTQIHTHTRAGVGTGRERPFLILHSLLHFVSYGLEQSCPQCLLVFSYFVAQIELCSRNFLFFTEIWKSEPQFLEKFLLAGAFCTTDPDSMISY